MPFDLNGLALIFSRFFFVFLVFFFFFFLVRDCGSISTDARAKLPFQVY